jgi:hypothetical protein
MAKKSRTPPPPKRTQGPRRRTDSGRPVGPNDRRNRLILYGLAISGVIALVAVFAVFALAGGDSGNRADSVASAMKAAGCTFKTYPEQARSPHYTSLKPNNPMKYNSFPPTSGKHYYIPVIWGIYDNPVEPYAAIHNLEHGGVIIQYGNKVPASEIQKIREFYQEDANAMLVAPYPALGDTIALRAWTHLAKCKRFDQDAFATFRDKLRYQAPEKFPPDQLEPGE